MTGSDPDQAWILAELIRYLEHTRSGAVDFDDMGGAWVSVRDGATLGTLRPGDPNTLEVAGRFGQLVAFAGMRLSRKLGVEVRPALSRAQLSDSAKRVQTAAADLVEHGILQGSLKVPNAISPIEIKVDLRSGRVTCAVTVDAPADGRSTTRINWLLRQLGSAPSSLLVEAFPLRARTGICKPLSEVVESPQVLFDDPKREIKTFALRLSAPIGTKRGQGAGSFVSSVLKVVDSFYVDIVQNLKPWSTPAPSVRKSLNSDNGPGEDEIQGELPVRLQRGDRPQPRPAETDVAVANPDDGNGQPDVIGLVPEQ